MPRISKARIVNFGYNDGRRLIADELFLFESSDGQEGRNVLINLANGGGKSVLVQLMMQPVLPKARVANRRIESFFNKPSDHCFILLEWIKDNSKEKLLTGISMAAREVSNDDTARGMQVKYYTFYTQYLRDDSPYSIANLPLSKKERGRFCVGDFDLIRNLARKSNHALEYYRDDDQAKWQKKLSEYGLIQEEWRMIERLNSEEGGLGKYFGEFKTSDALIDRLLIPTIEGKSQRDLVKGDSSLSTMLISNAKSYAKHEDVLKEKELFQAFEQGLAELDPMAANLWNTQDALRQTVRKLFGISDALRAKEGDLQAAQEQAQTESAAVEEKVHHIHWEQLSAKYYRQKEAFDAADEKWRLAEQEAEKQKAESENADRGLKILECARYYQKSCTAQIRIETIQKEISSRERETESAEELNRLKYSAACAVGEELQKVQPKADQRNTQLKEALAEKESAQQEVADAEHQCRAAQTAVDKQAGSLESVRRETDQRVGELGADLRRCLDCRYAEEEIEQFSKDLQSKKAEAVGKQNQVFQKIRQIEAEEREIPGKTIRLQVQIEKGQEELRKLQEELDQYDQREKAVEKIFEEYNQDFSMRFTDLLMTFLTAEQRENQARIAAVRREIVVADEEIEAAKRGEIHVPHAVIEYLESIDIPFVTCERYLLGLVEEKKLTSSACMEILQKSPALAYSIVLDDASIARFSDEERAKWLPAIVPILRHERLEKILRGERWTPEAIAFYSEESFSDREHYIAHLIEQRERILKRLELLEQNTAHLREQLQIAEAFPYSENWKKEQKGRFDQLVAVSKENQSKLVSLQKRQVTLTERRTTLTEVRDELQKSLLELGQKEGILADVHRRIENEDALLVRLAEQKEVLKEAERCLHETQDQLAQLDQRCETLSQQIYQLRAKLQELRAAKEKVADAKETPRESGNWRDLLERYFQCQRSIHQEIEDLQLQRDEEIERREEYEQEIAKREIEIEAYRDVESSTDREEEMRQICKRLLALTAEAEKRREDAKELQIRASSALDHTQSDLEPYGGVLEKSDVGDDFGRRLQTLQTLKRSIEERQKQYAVRRQKIERTYDRLENSLEGEERPENVLSVDLETDYMGQCEEGRQKLQSGRKSLDASLTQVRSYLRDLHMQFLHTTNGAADAIKQMIHLSENQGKGDAIYSLTILIEENRKNARLAIGKIETDLKEFENSRKDLIRQCLKQGQRIYEGLRQMENSSRVTIYEGKLRRPMISFDLPSEVDEEVAQASVTNEIERGVQELVAIMEKEGITEAEIKKLSEKIVGSRNLLRRYIGKDSIQVKAYKIDQNAQNSCYRTWGQTQVNNSGAEKFVVYFSVILTLINYTRDGSTGLQDHGRYSALILDNPFGATSSKHILIPMFAIAKHFRVQMICLSDINKMDIINCFDIVIKAMVKKRPMSNHELLTHEGNERIEHGFYRAEEMLLF